MGLFSKESKENFSVIEHYFKSEEIAYRYPEHNFLSGSILRVQPGQEAVLIKEGDCDGPYTNGRYVLDVNQLPQMRKFFDKSYSKSAFNCYVYFINKDKPFNMYWGTPEQIKVRDAHTGRIVRMFARGSISLSIASSLAFITKTNGQLASFSSEDIDDYLYNKTIERIISAIANALQIKKIPFVEIQSHINVISDSIKAQLENERVFEKYGILINEFNIVAIDINEQDFADIQKEENELERKKRQIELEAMEIRAKGFAQSDVMKEKGIYYDKERSYDVLQTAASNEGGIGGNGFVGAGVGLGVGLNAGMGLGSAIGNMAASAFTQTSPQEIESKICSSCRTKNHANSKFCSSCGVSLTKEIICRACGAENADHAKFCINCGQLLTPKRIKCPGCGEENGIDSKFCSGCGAKLID